MTSPAPDLNHAFLGLFLIIALIFPILPIMIARLVAPKKPGPVKLETYECGVEAAGDAWIQYRMQYYLYAIIFVIFDVEALFVYPWAVVFKELGLVGFLEMLIFLGILALGLVYALGRRVLTWE